MYNPLMVKPMREELVNLGFRELLSAEDVESTVKNSSGTLLIVVNSVCGCSAGGCRPGVAMSLQNEKKPDELTTVFAGVDKEATEKARSYFLGYPPSSPSVALLKNGKIVHMLERLDIEGHSPEQISENLKSAYEKFC